MSQNFDEQKLNSNKDSNGQRLQLVIGSVGVLVGFLAAKWYFSRKYESFDSSSKSSISYISLKPNKMDNTLNKNETNKNNNNLIERDYISIMTFNVWRSWPLDTWLTKNQAFKQTRYDRKESLISFFNRYAQTNDIFALQESNQDIINLLTESCKIENEKHFRIISSLHEENQIGNKNNAKMDPRNQACIVYNSMIYDCIEFDCSQKLNGAHFAFARLAPKSSKINYHIIVCSIHLTFPGTMHELKTGQSSRVRELRSICDYIENTLKWKNRNDNNNNNDNNDIKEVVFICGDLNDHFHSINIGMEYNYQHCWIDCNAECAPKTFPTPAAHCVEDGPDPQSETTYDWIMCQNKNKNENGSDNSSIECKGVTCSVVNYNYYGIYPSDHYPVRAVYCVESK